MNDFLHWWATLTPEQWISLVSVVIAAIGAILIVYQLYFSNKVKLKDEIKDRLQEVYLHLDSMNIELQKMELEINNKHIDMSVSKMYVETKNEVEKLSSLFMHVLNASAVRKVEVREGIIKFRRGYFKRESELEITLNKAWDQIIFLQSYVSNAYEFINLMKTKQTSINEVRETITDYLSDVFKRLIEIRKEIFVAIFFMGKAKVNAKKSQHVINSKEGKSARKIEIVLRKLPPSFTYINFLQVETIVKGKSAIKITKSFERFINIKDKSNIDWENHVQFMYMFSKPNDTYQLVRKYIQSHIEKNKKLNYYLKNGMPDRDRLHYNIPAIKQKERQQFYIEPTLENFEKFLKIVLNHFDESTIDYFKIETIDLHVVEKFFDFINSYINDPKIYYAIEVDPYYDKFDHKAIYVLHNMFLALINGDKKNKSHVLPLIEILTDINIIDSNKNKSRAYTRIIKSDTKIRPFSLRNKSSKVVYEYTYSVETELYRTFLNNSYPIHTKGTLVLLTKWMNSIVNLDKSEKIKFNNSHIKNDLIPTEFSIEKKESFNDLKKMSSYLSMGPLDVNKARQSLWEPVEFLRLVQNIAKIKETNEPVSLSSSDICEFAWMMWEIENNDTDIESQHQEHVLVNNTWI